MTIDESVILKKKTGHPLGVKNKTYNTSESLERLFKKSLKYYWAVMQGTVKKPSKVKMDACRDIMKLMYSGQKEKKVGSVLLESLGDDEGETER